MFRFLHTVNIHQHQIHAGPSTGHYLPRYSIILCPPMPGGASSGAAQSSAQDCSRRSVADNLSPIHLIHLASRQDLLDSHHWSVSSGYSYTRLTIFGYSFPQCSVATGKFYLIFFLFAYLDYLGYKSYLVCGFNMLHFK